MWPWQWRGGGIVADRPAPSTSTERKRSSGYYRLCKCIAGRAGLKRAAKEGRRRKTAHEGGSCGHRFALQLMTDEILMDREAVLTADCYLMDRRVISIFLVRKK